MGSHLSLAQRSILICLQLVASLSKFLSLNYVTLSHQWSYIAENIPQHHKNLKTWHTNHGKKWMQPKITLLHKCTLFCTILLCQYHPLWCSSKHLISVLHSLVVSWLCKYCAIEAVRLSITNISINNKANIYNNTFMCCYSYHRWSFDGVLSSVLATRFCTL